MLDLVLKLIDKLIELVKRREEVDKDLFSNFLVPAMTDFEAVHKSYVDSFRKYRECVADRNNALDRRHKVFDLIKEDMLDSIDLRGKVLALYQLEVDPVFSSFIRSIREYLDSPIDTKGYITEFVLQLIPGVGPAANAARISLCHSLIRCMSECLTANTGEDARRALALKLIDNKIEELKLKYNEVSKEFIKLKIRLLMPK